MEIRLVEKNDSKRLLEIYSPYIQTTNITFECQVPSLEEYTNRIMDIANTMPYLVAIENGIIIGYGYASKYRTREAYQWAVELSVYVDTNYQHKHVGTAIYQTLLPLLKELGYHQAYACITLPNQSSIAFHKKFDFQEIGIFHRCGYKQDTWLDTQWMELTLQNKEIVNPPKTIKDIVFTSCQYNTTLCK